MPVGFLSRLGQRTPTQGPPLAGTKGKAARRRASRAAKRARARNRRS